MNNASPDAKRISILCVILVGVILTAGLWPFHAPRNAVVWLQNENGLRFNGHGSAVSAAPFRAQRPLNAAGWSLEILLRPDQSTGGGSILAFDSSSDPWAPFLLRQYGVNLAVQRYLVDDFGHVSQPWFQVKDVFIAQKSVLITITSNRSSTALYVNGVLAGTSPDPGIVAREFTGLLLLGNSTFDDSWTGQIGGLAIYDRELAPIQVTDHAQRWMRNPDRLTMRQQSPIALYLFDERSGSTAHNLLDPTTSLTIPASYFVLHPKFLRSTWDEYSHANSFWKRLGFWKDLGLNIRRFCASRICFLCFFFFGETHWSSSVCDYPSGLVL